jgi:hypothetical protein
LAIEKKGNSKLPEEVALQMSNFGIRYWPWVALVTLFKYGNGCYLAWRVKFRGRQGSEKTLNNVESGM